MLTMSNSNKRPNVGQPLQITKRAKDSKSELQTLITPAMDCNKENVPSNNSDCNSATTSNSASSELTSLKIVNFNHLFQQFASITSHSTNNCQPNHIQFIKETPQGPLSSTISFKCQNCNYESTITTNPNPPAFCNNLMVQTCLNSGMDRHHLDNFCSTLDIAKISQDEFWKNEQSLLEAMRANVWKSMHDAAQEEAALARLDCSVAASGHPLITVIVHTNKRREYAAIFGKRTGKILFLGVRNLFCTICLRAEVLGEEPYEHHRCFKDRDSFPFGIIFELICQGFQYSIQMYGIIYNQLMNDTVRNYIWGEVSGLNPYRRQDITISRVKSLKEVVNDYISELKKLTRRNENVLPMMIEALKANIWKFRAAVWEPVKFLRYKELDPDEKFEMLRKRILNIPSHVLGEHEKCLELGGKCKKPYFKTKLVGNMKKCGYFDKIVACSQILLDSSSTLLFRYEKVLDDFSEEVGDYVKIGIDSLLCEANCLNLVINYNKKCKLDSQIQLIKQEDHRDDGRKALRDRYQVNTENGENVEFKLEVDDVKLT